MYGDSETMRRQVSRLREQGGDIRVMADRLVAQVEGIGWRGRAADTMRERMRERAGRLREAAGRHDTAADSLERHAEAVEDAKDLIAARERKATAIVADARTRIERVRGAEQHPGVLTTPDPDDEELAAFTPPAEGHRDWLDVELPGL